MCAPPPSTELPTGDRPTAPPFPSTASNQRQRRRCEHPVTISGGGDIRATPRLPTGEEGDTRFEP
ncbi:hypothetical protein YM304_06510 [Ilumatobacter coccineus YM16-304]|uniref:Uncharacterized protein n=1 Tax=Ilumatobacter coccineus (strain NBRC 103263 / KCTC 29153 / YM16-304) TaxID=1313172 RepID=A0A6C7E720_ILUCY|nr:hypothetical protein YM304_06510 [Ilumatobacter coccineus YM16-304]